MHSSTWDTQVEIKATPTSPSHSEEAHNTQIPEITNTTQHTTPKTVIFEEKRAASGTLQRYMYMEKHVCSTLAKKQ